MRAPFDLRPLLAALLAGVALGACGEGLYDADGVPALEGGGASCGTGQVLCGDVCTSEDAGHCGSSCLDCVATFTDVPDGGSAACLDGGQCGYECSDGLLKCASGCCETLALAAGERHTCALLLGGEVSCWGANGSGQIGDGTTVDRPTPRRVPLPAPAIAVGAGAAHSCAVVTGGTVHCWGENLGGQVLGSATGLHVRMPSEVGGVAGAVSVAAGGAHTCALLDGGAVRCWGTGAAAASPSLPAMASAVAAGRDHSCALVGTAVHCWGSNANGQLGVADAATGTVAVPISAGVRHLSAAGDQTCAATGTTNDLDLDDALRCWGDSLEGWGFASPQRTPKIPLKDVQRGIATIDKPVTRLAAGAGHVCLSDRDEAVLCLGANDRGQLGAALTGPGESATVPLPQPAVLPRAAATALAAGGAHTCAANSLRRVRCWGANDAGQLGDGKTTDPGVLVAPLGR